MPLKKVSSRSVVDYRVYASGHKKCQGSFLSYTEAREWAMKNFFDRDFCVVREERLLMFERRVSE